MSHTRKKPFIHSLISLISIFSHHITSYYIDIDRVPACLCVTFNINVINWYFIYVQQQCPGLEGDDRDDDDDGDDFIHYDYCYSYYLLTRPDIRRYYRSRCKCTIEALWMRSECVPFQYTLLPCAVGLSVCIYFPLFWCLGVRARERPNKCDSV